MSVSTREDPKDNWLKRVQEQSWEPEILISGIVLFALFQIPPLIERAAEFLNLYSIMIFSDGNVDEVLAAILLAATYWLIFGFTTHLIGRSIWAAFVGLSYVYEGGIRVERLKFGEAYRDLISKNIDYEILIVRLEKFCSRIFAVSFLLFMCILGVFFFLTVVGGLIATILELKPEWIDYTHYIDPVLQVVGLIYLFDFVTLGLIKRIPFVNKIYYPFYRVMSFLTLAPLYRSIYYGFVTNHKSWKVGLGMLIFSAITFVMVQSINQEVNLADATVIDVTGGEDFLFPGNYANLANGDPSIRMVFESDIIERNVAKVFVVHGSLYEEEMVLKPCNYEELAESEKYDLDSLEMECLKRFYNLQLNGERIQPDYLFAEDRNLKRKGLVAYLDLAHLPRGMHEIRLYWNLIEDGETDSMLVADVEFFKTVPADLPTTENE
jgi:hypothetical protein